MLGEHILAKIKKIFDSFLDLTPSWIPQYQARSQVAWWILDSLHKAFCEMCIVCAGRSVAEMGPFDVARREYVVIGSGVANGLLRQLSHSRLVLDFN